MTGSLSLKEAADRLGVSPRTMRRYVQSGSVEALLVAGPHGQEYRITTETLAKLEEDRGKGGQGSRGQVVPDLTGSVVTTLATALEADRERLERAWSRIADLERENEALRSQLQQLGSGKPGLLRRIFGG